MQVVTLPTHSDFFNRCNSLIIRMEGLLVRFEFHRHRFLLTVRCNPAAGRRGFQLPCPLTFYLFHLPSSILPVTGCCLSTGGTPPFTLPRQHPRHLDKVPLHRLQSTASSLAKYRFVACKVPLRRLRGPISPVARANNICGGMKCSCHFLCKNARNQIFFV